MADHRDEGPGENGTPVPRDLPDQQADAGQDPWDVDAPDQPEDETVPDTDEAGTGRQGAPHTAGANPDQPVPDEPSA
ncbi:hypothetical protein ABZ614_15550 [Streptomyces sp. NPDC013178]|uniref:hypothetical protein n=1 Tax=unclassified Streptomyces TaxID=2593676 RepID=UPI0033CD73A7